MISKNQIIILDIHNVEQLWTIGKISYKYMLQLFYGMTYLMTEKYQILVSLKT